MQYLSIKPWTLQKFKFTTLTMMRSEIDFQSLSNNKKSQQIKKMRVMMIKNWGSLIWTASILYT